jgi:hypothetical protein
VKNQTGVDSAESARRLLQNQYGAWFEAAGASVPRDENGDVSIAIEISPLAALDAAELAPLIEMGQTIEDGYVLVADEKASPPKTRKGS